MRWTGDSSPKDGRPDLLLREMIADVYAVSGQDPDIKETTIEAVGETLRLVLPDISGADSRPLLAGISARVFRDLGAGELARRLLIFGSGIVTAASWEIAGGGTLWILDLERLACGSGPQTELSLVRSLDAALMAMAEVWDDTSGHGPLGLRKLEQVVHSLLGEGASPRRCRALERELFNGVGARLKMIAAERDWTAVPEVLNLTVMSS